MESEEIKKQIKYLPNQGFIHPSTSQCRTPIMSVPMKDESWHICVYYWDMKKNNGNELIYLTSNWLSHGTTSWFCFFFL